MNSTFLSVKAKITYMMYFHISHIACSTIAGGEWLCLVLVLAGVAAWVDEEVIINHCHHFIAKGKVVTGKGSKTKENHLR